MPYNRLSTAKIARAVGCHPNTVRLYEQIGFLSPVERSPKGYRLYTGEHLDQARLVRLLMVGAWPGKNIRRSCVAVIRRAAAHDWPGALELAYHHRSLVRLEREYAETAAAYLESWARGEAQTGAPVEADAPLHITEAARLLNLSPDTLRGWERNGLLEVPRNPSNRYRRYHPAQVGRLRVIRMLRQAGYSTMAILRMLVALDRARSGLAFARGELRARLDTPLPDEEAFVAADRWLSTLEQEERRAAALITLMEEVVERCAPSTGEGPSAARRE